MVNLKAPVGDTKRITKPDPKKKNEKFKPVRNNPADVELVQLMLRANGYPMEVTGKCTPALIKDIRSFQSRQLGFKKPDGIVDPGMRTWNAGLAKLSAMISADQKIERYKLVEGGKVKWVDKAEFEKGQEALKREVLSKANMMYSEAEGWVDFCNDIEKTRQGTDGLVDALVEFSVSCVTSKVDPPWNVILNARSEASSLKALVNRKVPDWQKVYDQDKKATAAYNKGVKAFKAFIKARIDTASAIIGNLEIVRDTSFAVVEAYITAELVVTKGMTPAKANAIAAASTEGLKSGAGQFGEYLAGNNVTWDGAAKKVFIDSFIAGLAGAAGGKLGASLANGLGGRMAAAIMPKLSGNFSKKAVELFFGKFLSTKAGEALVTNALKEVIGLAKPMIEKGRAPNMKEIREAIAKTLCAGVVGTAAGAALKGFSDKFASQSATFLEKTLAPSVMAGIQKDLIRLYGAETVEKLAKDHAGEIYVKIGESLTGKWIESGAVKALESSDGTQSAKQMQKLAEAELRKDKALRKKIEDMIKSGMKEEAKKLEGAR